jgi:hypothetical protein
VLLSNEFAPPAVVRSEDSGDRKGLKRRRFLRAAAGLLAGGARPAAADLPAFADVGFIDHHNLRYPGLDRRALSSAAAEIRGNLAKAASYGARHYVLFSRAFESLVTYDFEVPGLGHIGAAAFPPGSAHRDEARIYREALREALQAARQRGIRTLFHTNQFEFPPQVFEKFGERMKGTAAVCPARPLVWQLLRGKIQEFFTLFPDCAGLQLTADETQVSALACRCGDCRNMGAGERIDRLVREAAAACSERGKELQARTWGRVGELSEERSATSMFDHLPAGVVVSVKHTRGDFCLGEPASELIGQGNGRQLVEFDSWGEYLGWNNFPCYLGDIIAERMRLAAEKGVSRVASRLCWNPFTNYIFDRPWGNEVNLHVFARLAANPALDADSVLRDWVADRYAPKAHAAAFRLYKRSAELQSAWLTCGGRNSADHSRIYYRRESTFERARGSLRSLVSAGYLLQRENLSRRRRSVDEALAQAEQLVAALGAGCPAEWRREMLRGARTEWRVAHGVTDQMELLGIGLKAIEGKPLPDLGPPAESIRRRLEGWRREDPGGVELYHGEAPTVMLAEVRAMARARRPESSARY